ncbi:MAG TPA: tetratricopeptide repeat protein [Pyrinomonadaceae bacterium]|nr:tetratricopeptide repeat protein [Pyrinomonadaceae bacterium]
MKGFSIFGLVSIVAAIAVTVAMSLNTVNGQDVGVGGGAGIFRPRNPETKKRTSRPATPVIRRGPTRTPVNNAAVEERVEELLGKGNEFRDARRFAEAESSYQEVLKLKPRDARAAYGLGNVYTDQQRWDTAETSYRNAVSWAPSDVESLVALSVVLVQPRTGAGNAKRLADAEAFARRAVQIEPKNAVAWDRLGVALQARGLVNNETEHAYRRAVELDPQFAAAYAHLARALNKLGRGDEAVKLYEQAATLAKDPATLNLIAESLQAEQQWQNSEPILKRSLELDPRNAQALYMLGRMLVVFKRFSEAEPHLKLAHEVNQKAFEPLTLLGRTYLALDRFEEAEVTYERAADLASTADRKQLSGEFGFEGVGDGFMKLKNKAGAARAYQRALQLDPTNRDLERKLAQAR